MSVCLSVWMYVPKQLIVNNETVWVFVFCRNIYIILKCFQATNSWRTSKMHDQLKSYSIFMPFFLRLILPFTRVKSQINWLQKHSSGKKNWKDIGVRICDFGSETLEICRAEKSRHLFLFIFCIMFGILVINNLHYGVVYQ